MCCLSQYSKTAFGTLLLEVLQMGLHIEIEGVRPLEAREHIESTIRECIGELPKYEDWDVSINRKDLQSVVVVVRTPHQARRKVFFSNVWNLSEDIPAWLHEHPVH